MDDAKRPASMALSRCLSIGVLLLLISFLVAGDRAGADCFASPTTVSVTQPDGYDDTIGESDDFATAVLGDPWDMNERNDIPWSDNIVNIYASNGVWHGTGSSTDPGFFTPFQGMVGAAYVGNIGANYPIDTSRYTRLTFRVYATDYNNIEVLWFSGPDWVWSGKFWNYNPTPPGWRTYDFDLTNPQVCAACKAGDPWQANPWVYGIRIDPTDASGAQLAVDWVRLSNPHSSPSYDIVWSGQGERASLFVDDDGDAIPCNTRVPIALDLDNIGSYSWTPNLPPGEYYIYVEVDGGGSCSPGPLTINQAPILNILAPSMSSGEDYAATVLGDPWDMSSPEDVADMIQIANFDFTGGILNALTTGEHNPWGDSGLLLPVSQSVPIDTSRYKYLTWRMWHEGVQDVSNGWVSRYLWARTKLGSDHSTSDDVIICEGWHNYKMDLSEVLLEPGSPNLGWTGKVRVFRFDPTEVPAPAAFHLDYIHLRADDRANHSFHIIWELIDPDSTCMVSLYYDTDRAGFDGQLIAILTDQPDTGPASPWPSDNDAFSAARAQPQQEGEYRLYLPLVFKNLFECPGVCYNWDTVSVPAGEYYIYAVVEDGHNVTRWYSETPVIISH